MKNLSYQKFWTMMVFLMSFLVGTLFAGTILLVEKRAESRPSIGLYDCISGILSILPLPRN